MKFHPILKLLLVLFSIILPLNLNADSCANPQPISIPGSDTDYLNRWQDRYNYYSFTPNSNGTVHIYSTGFNGDMDAWLLEPTCSSYYVRDTSSNANIDLTYNLTAGTTYKIQLKAYSGSSSYTLYIDFDIPIPTITPSTFSVSEFAPIGTVVGTVPISSTPTSVTPASLAGGKFAIDLNGVITVTAILDYETPPTTYNSSITASNNAGSDTETIIINIIDESAPVAFDQTFNVDESSSNGTQFGTVAVVSGNPTSYSFNNSVPDNAFSLDNNGVLRINNAAALDAIATPQYVLEVRISNPEGYIDINTTINVDATMPTGDDNRRDFTNVSLFGNDSISINGNILLIGNQLLCKNSSDGAACQAPTVGVNNNSVDQHKARIDTSAGAPSSNTWAKLTLEDGSGSLAHSDEIIFARLYWSARIVDNYVSESEKNQARTIQIKGPNSTSYTTLTAPISRFNWFKYSSTFDYSASQDVTAYVKANGAGDYSVGGIKASNGGNTFAAWALIVIVQNPDRNLNNLSIYDGFQAIYSGNGYPTSVTVPASGFLTPVGTEPFQASLFVFTGESESNLNDTAEIQNASGTWFKLKDGYNNSNDIFNASIYTPENGFRSDYSGEANPNFKNVVGTDIDKLEINKKADANKQYLSHSQTSTNIKISSGGDRYTLNMFAFETELHYPKLCYDYSYAQDGFVYTELNDGTQEPFINIPSNTGSPVDVNIYIKSMDNDVNFDHISIYSDMNLSELTYNGHFQRTQTNAFEYGAIETEFQSTDCLEATNQSSQSCKTTSPVGNFRTSIGKSSSGAPLGYPLFSSGGMHKNDFMYFKYSVLPTNSDPLHSPLKLFSDIQYSLTSGGALVDPVWGLPFGGERMPLCPPSTVYAPEWGIFNVIDANINALRTGATGSEYINNLLTQVPQRPFSVDVVALNPNSNPPNSPQDINTSIALELVDIKGFHDVNVSCREPAVKFSERVYLNFSNENRKPVSNLSTNYAKQDAAYRIWYIHDGNISHIITNWASITNGDGTLAGITNLYEQIPDAPDVCWTECSGAQSPAQTRSAGCYECLRTHFGYPLCSRDNFSIRPESFHISIKDINMTSAISLEAVQNNNNPGVNLAAGYNYFIDINATNHIDNNKTLGYSKQFLQNDTNAYSTLTWINNGRVCNNELNNSLPIPINNGSLSAYSFSNPEVGNYKLQVFDSQWTSVDQGTPPHHKNNQHWLYPQADCNNNSLVLDKSNSNADSNAYVGCNISSSHSVDRTVTQLPALRYYDLNISFIPYAFNINNILLSHGTDFNTTFPSTIPLAYIYMSDMSTENNMSLNAVGTIIAEGKNGNTLTNYTNSCYAEDLNFTLNTLLPADGDQISFRARYFDIDPTLNIITSETNSTNTTVSPSNIFHDSNQGVSSLRAHYNYTKNSATALNPKQLNLTSLDVNCSNLTNCTMVANQTPNYKLNASVVLNRPLNIYYGRSNVPRQRLTTSVGVIPIYYEVYCDENGDRSILPNGVNSKFKNDPRWFNNIYHTSPHGTVNAITQRIGNSVSESTPATGNAPDSVGLTYNGTNGYPYKTTMNYTPSSWLIYNKYTPGAVASFEVEFIKANSSWAGKKATDTTTKTTGSSITNRRSMW